jgi:hypothetical protein
VQVWCSVARPAWQPTSFRPQTQHFHIRNAQGPGPVALLLLLLTRNVTDFGRLKKKKKKTTFRRLDSIAVSPKRRFKYTTERTEENVEN